MMTRRIFLVTGAAAALVAGSATAKARPTVVCDSYPLAWCAMRLAGDMAEVSFPVPAGVDPSFWRPSIAEISAIQAADMIVLNGAGFATWTTKTTLPRARTVDTSAGFADAYIATDTVTHSHGGDGEHSHTGTASYIWLDFALMTRQAEALAAALKRVLPDAVQTIDGNFATLATDLAALDAKARAVGAVASNVPMIASHPRYQYFARAYGFDLASVEWDTAEPQTEEQWQILQEVITRTGAKVFIWEAAPNSEDHDRMTALGLASAVFPPLANTPVEGDFLSGMNQTIDELRTALDNASSG